MREFDHSLSIGAPAHGSSTRSSTPPISRRGGTSLARCAIRDRWAATRIEWPTPDVTDDVLGRLGGAFRGTVIEFKAGREFFVADAYWLPPDGEPIGPMAFEASCTPLGERVVLRVRQSGGRRVRDGRDITSCWRPESDADRSRI